MKADRRWWNDGRLEREQKAFGLVKLPERVGMDGQTLPEAHWWETCTPWCAPNVVLGSAFTMYKVKL